MTVAYLHAYLLSTFVMVQTSLSFNKIYLTFGARWCMRFTLARFSRDLNMWKSCPSVVSQRHVLSDVECGFSVSDDCVSETRCMKCKGQHHMVKPLHA